MEESQCIWSRRLRQRHADVYYLAGGKAREGAAIDVSKGWDLETGDYPWSPLAHLPMIAYLPLERVFPSGDTVPVKVITCPASEPLVTESVLVDELRVPETGTV